jgi:hypothetical protein
MLKGKIMLFDKLTWSPFSFVVQQFIALRTRSPPRAICVEEHERDKLLSYEREGGPD